EHDSKAGRHDESEAWVPAAGWDGGEIEEPQNLQRIGHLRNIEAEAEEEARAGGYREIADIKGFAHDTIPVTVVVRTATAKKMPTATKDRLLSRASPQM